MASESIARYNLFMSRTAQEILEEARQLPPDEVDWIVESLLIKYLNPAEAQIEAAWDSEIKRRLDEIDSGAVELIPGEQVRAEMIARSELVNANGYGSLMGMYESRSMGLDIRKGWDSTGEACPVCLENTDSGFIELEAAFPSGHQHPTAHPDCRCVLVSKVIKED